jgi:hypothetical protein
LRAMRTTRQAVERFLDAFAGIVEPVTPYFL